MNKPTIYDIAREANVSIATVSKVINGIGRVSDATRKRVLQIVADLNFEPNVVASALAGGNTRTIGLLLPDVNNPYFSEIVRGAEDEAFGRGYSVLICNTDHNAKKEHEYIRTLRQKQMDGIAIATGSTPAQTIEELVEGKIPVVLLSRSILGASVATVAVDSYAGGRLAAEYLISLGHKAVGYLSEPLTVTSSVERLRGFQEVMDEHGRTTVLSSDHGFGITTGQRMAAQLLSNPEITALFGANDQLAVGALQACREMGRKVPEQISVVGFDDTVFAKIVTPTLTTVAQPMYQMGAQTLRLLIEAIETGVQPTKSIVFPPELMIRESAGPIRSLP